MPPSPREQHSAGEIAGNLFIFGGKSRFHPSSHDGSPLMTNASDEVYGDLWELQLEHPTDFAYELPVEQQGSIISQEAPTLLKINATMAAVPPLTYVTPRDGYCVKDLTVKVVFEHPCITQVRMSLFGPGPLTGSPNFFPPADGLEVLLLSNVATNSTYCVGGKHSFVFNDNFERDPSSCCSTKFSGPYRPAGKLSEFIDTTMLAEWILSIQDLSQDGLVGKVHSFEMDFVSAPCFPSYTWTNLTQSMTGDLPTPRYDSYMITYRESLFIYGGRDALDRTLHDLYRYDVSSHHWTMLTPTNFQVPLLSSPTTLFGSSLALTSWGIFQFGGYARLPTLTISSQSPRGGIYTHDVTLLDLITMRWSDVQVDHGDQQDILFGGHTIPHERYLASLVFLPASTFRWRNAQSERLLYDAPKRSYHSNFQGPVADSLLLFGGFDGAIGAAVDGSLGGYFNDLWMLRLNTLSTSESHQKQRQYLQKHCSWRQSAGAQRAGATSCLSATTGERCDMRDLLLLPWCAGRNQTLSA